MPTTIDLIIHPYTAVEIRLEHSLNLQFQVVSPRSHDFTIHGPFQ